MIEKHDTVSTRIVIFSTGPKHSKFDSWTLENANHTKNTPFPNLKSCLCVYMTHFCALYQVST